MTDLSRRERLLAACSHAAILIPGFGFAVPVIIWGLNRSKSEYIRLQSLQALVFQIIQTLFLQLILLVEGVVVLIFIRRLLENALALLLAKIMFFPIVGLFLYIGVALVAAISCISAKNWVYPFFGRKLLAYLEATSGSPGEHEDRLAASISHAGIFYPTSGLLIPAVILIILRGQLSTWLKFQAAQSLAVQAGWFVFSNLVLVTETVLAVPLIITFMTSTDFVLKLAHPQYLVYGLSASLGISIGSIFLLGPLLTVFAMVAIIRILKGREYNYPLIGKIIYKRIYSGVD